MFDLVFKVIDGKPLHESMSDRQLVLHLTKELHAMALNFEKLTAAVTRSNAAGDAVLALAKKLEPDPAVEAAAQAVVDSLATALDDHSATIEAVLPPPDPVAKPE